MSLDSPRTLSLDGTGLKVGIVAARFNQRFVDGLVEQATAILHQCGVAEDDLEVIRVPGSGELPCGVQLMLTTRQLDVCMGLGVVIRGETPHDRLVAEAAQSGMLRVALDARVPVIAGVVTTNDDAQAQERCLGAGNRGAEFARAAIEMAMLKQRLLS